AEIAALVQEAQGHTCAIVGTYNGHLRPGQLELISALCKASVPVIAVAMRNPYDLADLPKSVYALEVYEYTKRSIYAAARVIAGEEQATAHLPVKL
ncbi:MAG: glycoside hydrolase family 3, partial [Oscillospiraceae bacterium]|nr:glycoside hydrolase family 3 [Oscillospiraceae bacterium]